MTPRIVNKEAKREEIYTAAMKLFATQGVAETTISQIAKASGVGKGTIYEYFESKEEIILTAFLHVLDEFDEYMETHFEISDDPIETIKSFIIHMTSFYDTVDKESIIMIMMFQIGSSMSSNAKYHRYLDDVIRIKNQAFLKYYPPLIDAIQNAFEDKLFRPINSNDLLQIILFFISGNAMMKIFSTAVDVSDIPIKNSDTTVETFVDLIVNGLKTQINGGE